MATGESSTQYLVERSATLAAPPERVYAQLVDFHRWADWSPWEDIDPAMERTFSGANSGEGAVYGWSGNRKAGQGRMEITEATPSSKVEIDLRFVKPFKATNTTWFTLVPFGGSTELTWTMVGRKTFMTKVMGLFTSMYKMIGKDFDRGLERLRVVVET